MSRILSPSSLALLSFIAFALLICAPGEARPASPLLAPSDRFLRAFYDTDPSDFLGRFVDDNAVEVDETMMQQRLCSQYITSHVIDAGDVSFDELFRATPNAALSAGLQNLLRLGVRISAINAIRVRYTLHKKMVASIADPAAYDACCKAALDPCTRRYVSAYLMGSGATYILTNMSTRRNIVPTFLPDISTGSINLPGQIVEDGRVWHRGVFFPKPVYFAFQLSGS